MASDLRLKRLREWAADLGLTHKAMLEAVRVGHLKAVQTGIGPNSPFRCHEGHIRDWLESREVVGRKVW